MIYLNNLTRIQKRVILYNLEQNPALVFECQGTTARGNVIKYECQGSIIKSSTMYEGSPIKRSFDYRNDRVRFKRAVQEIMRNCETFNLK